MRLRLRTIVCGVICGLMTLATVTSIAGPQEPAQRSDKEASEDNIVDLHKIFAEVGHAPDPIKLVKDITEVRIAAPATVIVEANWIRSVEGHDDDVVSVSPLTPHQVAITAKKAGETDVVVTNSKGYRYLVRFQVTGSETVLDTRPMLEFLNHTVVSAQVGGILQSGHVRLGEQVEKGARLGLLENTDIDAELAAVRVEAESDIDVEYAKASHTIAKLKFESAEANAASYSTGELANLKLEFERARLNIEKVEYAKRLKQAQLVVVEARREACLLRAPHNGRVTKLHAGVGKVIQSGDAAFEITDLRTLRARFFVPSGSADDLRIDQCVRFVPTDEKSPILFGRLTFCSASVHPVTQEVECHAVLDNPHGKIRAGQAGSLRILASYASNRVLQPKKTSKPISIKEGEAGFLEAANVFVDFGHIKGDVVPLTVMTREEFADESRNSPALVEQTQLRVGQSIEFKRGDQVFRLRITGVTVTDEGKKAFIDVAALKSTGEIVALQYLEPDAFIHVVGVLFRNEETLPTLRVIEPKSVEIVATKSQLAEIKALLKRLGESKTAK